MSMFPSACLCALEYLLLSIFPIVCKILQTGRSRQQHFLGHQEPSTDLMTYAANPGEKLERGLVLACVTVCLFPRLYKIMLMMLMMLMMMMFLSVVLLLMFPSLLLCTQKRPQPPRLGTCLQAPSVNHQNLHDHRHQHQSCHPLQHQRQHRHRQGQG